MAAMATNQNRIKVTEDGFVWKVLNRKIARKVINTGIFQLYGLRDDDSEFEICDIEEMEEHIDHGGLVGIECGFLDSDSI